MSKIPSAYPSPRIDSGKIKWYEGDTFDLTIEFEFVDQDGEPVSIKETDSIEMKFLDDNKKHIKTFEFANIENNCITLTMDEQSTELFKRGRYTYDMYLIGDRRATIANDNRVIVE